jgi:secondary thiamine-phosphate synthase enzyme
MDVDCITFDTTAREQLVDITDGIAEIAREYPTAGALLVSSQHTTAAITINEGYDPDVADDLVRALSPLADRDDYEHAEGNSDSHVKVALLGASQLVPVADGELVLGRWQRIFFCEFDGPRTQRAVVVSPLAGA